MTQKIDLALIESLDALRDESPAQAAMSAVEASSESERSFIPYLLGVFGSTHRQIGDLDLAHNAVTYALSIASQNRDTLGRAQLLQRLAIVYLDRGQYALALTLSEQAAVIYARIGDIVGIGKSLVDQAACYYHTARYHRSIEALKIRLEVFTRKRTKKSLLCASYSCS